MMNSVEIPVWVLILVGVLAAIAALERFLLPSMRWYLRRRMEKVVSKLNDRLERPIEPFKLYRRHDMIQRLIYDPAVFEAIQDHAHEEGVPENVAFEMAHRYAREIVPSFSASLYFGFAIKLARAVSTMLYRVRLGHYDEAAIKAIDKDATVVFVINHRSNMDYFLVTYLAAERSALSYAVGEWARVWPLKSFIRAMGAYFIRRKSRNMLYRRVLARYVQMATKGGVTQAVFPEGGLSLDGSVKPPKLGILSYVLTAAEDNPEGDVVFVPVAVNYDRVLEDRVLIEAAELGERKFKFHIFAMLGFIGRQIKFKLMGRYHRFGYAAVSFGNPLSVNAFQAANPNLRNEAIGRELMTRIKDVVPVLPVPLVAHILMGAEQGLKKSEIEAQLVDMVATLRATKAHVHLPRDNTSYATTVGLRMLRLRHFVSETGDANDPIYQIAKENRAQVAYYANSIAHLLPKSA
ncbi:MAG: 1-acyl-sn-glycerol-3-phosphate acyltransferase [Halocynthiibacter sp.]